MQMLLGLSLACVGAVMFVFGYIIFGEAWREMRSEVNMSVNAVASGKTCIVMNEDGTHSYANCRDDEGKSR